MTSNIREGRGGFSFLFFLIYIQAAELKISCALHYNFLPKCLEEMINNWQYWLFFFFLIKKNWKCHAHTLVHYV